jgi:hypothetical protein
MSYPECPEYVDGRWCSDCGEEMAFSGVSESGFVHFFCENCTYRRDWRVEEEVVERYNEGETGAA